MYARNYNNDGGLTFKRGEYNIPANYRGNAFLADEIPCTDESENTEPDVCKDSLPQYEEPCDKASEEPVCKLKEDSYEACPCSIKDKNCGSEKPKEGIVRSVISRFERGLEFDDLLLIGLILLMLHGEKRDGEKNNDEIILILAALFLFGF